MSATEVVTAPAEAVTVAKYKIGELKAAGYTRIKEFTNPNTVMEMLNYIDFLAMNNATNADSIELPYEQGKNEEWKLDRTQVTALFFGHLESIKEAEQKNISLPDDSVRLALKKMAENRKASALSALQTRVRDHITAWNDRQRQAADYMLAAKKAQDEIDMMSGGEDKSGLRIDQLIETLKTTNWNFHRYNPGNNTIDFVNRGDVTLRYIDPAAGLRYEINCGKYQARINLTSMAVAVTAHERGMPNDLSSCPHPHISGSNVCWGNAEQTVRDAMLVGDPSVILKVLDSLLTNYNASSPHLRIADFKRFMDKRDEREREKHGKKEKAMAANSSEGDFFDEDVFDDEPEFVDDFEGGDNE